VRRALTGIQPSGTLHIGNYLGSIKPAIALQKSYAAYYFIADYHALTSTADPDVLRSGTREIAATFMALGLDLDSSVLYRQSNVPEVCELAWILACQISTGVLDRGHAVKAAVEGGREANAGTLFYPVLMAADILLYDSDLVPVGRDQKQHVEIARDIAEKVNYRYGEGTLVVPEVSIREDVGVVPGLDGRKMSKSYGNQIALWDTPKRMRKRIMRVVTDSRGVDEPKDPDTCNVFNLYKLFAKPNQIADLRSRYLRPGLGYGHAKQALFESVEAELGPARARYEDLLANPELIDDALNAGARRAREAALKTLSRVRKRVGLT
jgi:tryptophanyl-tRNA synthetase